MITKEKSLIDRFVLEPVADLDQCREEWSQLAAASGNVFLTPEWLGAWWQTFGEGRELAIQMVRRGDGSPVAILPLYRDRRLPSSLRMIGHTQSDLLGPVCAPEDRDLAARALGAILAADGSDLFVGNSLERDEGWTTALGGTVLDSMTSPVLDLAGRSWDQVLAGRSSNFRGQMRRVERRLEREHEVSWRLASEASASADLDLLIDLHRRRWDGESGAFEGLWGELHREFVPIAAARGWLRMWVLELDGEPAGVTYNLRFGEVESFYQSGRDPDPAREKLRLGLALQIKAIRAAADDGVAEYRFLRGDEKYKSRFADRDEPVQTVVVPLRLRARPLLPLLRLAPRLPGAARRRLMRVVTAMTPATLGVSEFATEGAGVYALAVV